MFTASVGIGKNDDARRAGADAMTQALASLTDKRADCVLVFGSALLDQDALVSGIVDAAPNTPIVGCSTAGEISSESLSSEGGVVVVAFASDTAHFGTGFGTHMRWNARQSGIDCAQTVHDALEGKMRAGLFFGNVLAGGMEQALSGLLERTGEEVALAAAGSADNLHFFETGQYYAGKVYDDALVGMGISGNFTFASAFAHGYLPVGVLRKVSRAEGNAIHEIDGAPAVRLYEEYFGEQYATMLQQGRLTAFASSYPLGIYEQEYGHPILRTPLHVDVDSGIIAVGGAVPQGAGLRLMISDRQQGLATARDAARALMNGLSGKKPKFVFMCSSAARKKLFGGEAGAEVRAVQEEVGRDVPIAGFYGFAECSRAASAGSPVLENGSILLAAIAE